MLWQKRPHRAQDAQEREQNQQNPRNDALSYRNIFPEQLQMERDGQDDRDDRAKSSTQERAYRVKRGEDD